MSLWHDALYIPVNWHFTYLLDQTTRLLVSCGHSLVVVMFDFYFLPNYLLLFDFPAGSAECIVVASMGHWGTCHPRFPFNFLVTSELHKLSLFHCTWLLTRAKIQNIQACSIVKYCHCLLGLWMDVSIKLCSLSFMLLLARNPGDATGRMQQHG